MIKFTYLFVSLSLYVAFTTAQVNCPGGVPVYQPNVPSGTEVAALSYIVADNCYYWAAVQEDGNFVIYRGLYPNNPEAVWQSLTSGHGSPPYTLFMQTDGNLVLYSGSGYTWSTGTNGVGAGPWTLTMQNDGNLVIYDATGGATWNAGTGNGGSYCCGTAEPAGACCADCIGTDVPYGAVCNGYECFCE